MSTLPPLSQAVILRLHFLPAAALYAGEGRGRRVDGRRICGPCTRLARRAPLTATRGRGAGSSRA